MDGMAKITAPVHEKRHFHGWHDGKRKDIWKTGRAYIDLLLRQSNC